LSKNLLNVTDIILVKVFEPITVGKMKDKFEF